MKKKISIIILIFILILLVFIAIFFDKPKEKSIKCEMDLNKAYNDVNEFYINEFEVLDLSFEFINIKFPDILFNIVDIKNVLYAVSRNDENEYFVILEDISEQEKETLKKEIEIQKELLNQYFTNTEIITKNNYTYFVVSLDKTSIIKGIINSNIYCENN